MAEATTIAHDVTTHFEHLLQLVQKRRMEIDSSVAALIASKLDALDRQQQELEKLRTLSHEAGSHLTSCLSSSQPGAALAADARAQAALKGTFSTLPVEAQGLELAWASAADLETNLQAFGTHVASRPLAAEACSVLWDSVDCNTLRARLGASEPKSIVMLRDARMRPLARAPHAVAAMLIEAALAKSGSFDSVAGRPLLVEDRGDGSHAVRVCLPACGDFAVVVRCGDVPLPSPLYLTVRKSLIFGGRGAGRGQFQDPAGLACSPLGLLYVADFGNHRIQAFRSCDGSFVSSWGGEGTAAGAFQKPIAVAVGPSNLVYISDFGNHRVQVFTPEGKFVRQFGTPGSAPGHLQHPVGIAVDASGLVYVADSGNHRIQVFNDRGTLMHGWGSQGSAPGQLNSPFGIAVSPSGNVFVADYCNHRVQVFRASDGGFLRMWGSFGTSPGHLNSPFSVCLDRAGLVYVTDYGNHRVQVFREDGFYVLVRVFGTQGTGLEVGQMTHPWGVAVAGLGEVFVADNGNHRVQLILTDEYNSVQGASS